MSYQCPDCSLEGVLAGTDCPRCEPERVQQYLANLQSQLAQARAELERERGWRGRLQKQAEYVFKAAPIHDPGDEEVTTEFYDAALWLGEILQEIQSTEHESQASNREELIDE